MTDIFNIQLPIDFNSDFITLFDQLNMNKYTPEKNAELIKDFIIKHDKHKGFTYINKVNKTTGLIKKVKTYYAEQFNEFKIDNYLPIIKSRKTNSYTYYRNEPKDLVSCRLQNSIIIKAYILDSIHELTIDVFIIECLKLYNRIYHKECGISPRQFFEYVKYAYNNHDENLCKGLADFKNRTYIKKEKYIWKAEDFGSLVDNLTLEENYNIWLKTDYQYIKDHNENVKDVSFMTFRRILKQLNIKKKYATRKTTNIQEKHDKLNEKVNIGFVDDDLFTSLDNDISINISTKGKIYKTIDINSKNLYVNNNVFEYY